LKTRIGEIPMDLSPGQECLTITFSTSSSATAQRWKNKNLAVDFMADYFGGFFPCRTEAPNAETSRTVARSMIAFAANELLENALKYNFDPTFPVAITLRLRDDSVIFTSNNSLDPAETGQLEAYLREMIAGDPMTMYLAQVEENARSGSDSASKIGLLTLRNDYRATVGWEIGSPSDQKSSTTATLMTVVQIPVGKDFMRLESESGPKDVATI
jgi:hypothetical protein